MHDTPRRSNVVFGLYPSYLSGKNGLKTKNDNSGVYTILRREATKYLGFIRLTLAARTV